MLRRKLVLVSLCAHALMKCDYLSNLIAPPDSRVNKSKFPLPGNFLFCFIQDLNPLISFLPSFLLFLLKTNKEKTVSRDWKKKFFFSYQRAGLVRFIGNNVNSLRAVFFLFVRKVKNGKKAHTHTH